MSAVPDDISTNQRAWYDAVDIDADGDYTDNQAGDSAIGTWRDKSGQGNHVSSTGGSRPTYRTSNPSSQRNGVDFDGSNDYLKDSNDIWSGSVTHSEIFIVSKVDKYTQSFIFSSMKTHNHRLSAHLPWGGNSNPGTSYFDHGECCSNSGRLQGNISPLTTWNHYFWHLIGDGSTYQAVVQDAKVKLFDTNGVGVYNSTGGTFSLAQKTFEGGKYYNGKIYEAIFYQRNLNNAQRTIMSAYLSAKWNKAFASSPDYVDVYNGDNTGDYDYFLGGIGQESDGIQSIGTTQGLTITNNNFLANGKYVVAGVDYLTKSPTVGTESAGWLGDNSTTDSYDYRASRLWYVDNTGTGGTVNLSFDANSMGIPIENGADYGLLCRDGAWGNFAEVGLDKMVNGVVSFDYLPTDDVCTIGKKKVNQMIIKTSCVLSDSFNANSNAKRIPGATIRYAIEVNNILDTQVDNVLVNDVIGNQFDETTISNPMIDSTHRCQCLNPISLGNNGINGGINSNEVILDFGTLSVSSSKCGYFEAVLK